MGNIDDESTEYVGYAFTSTCQSGLQLKEFHSIFTHEAVKDRQRLLFSCCKAWTTCSRILCPYPFLERMGLNDAPANALKSEAVGCVFERDQMWMYKSLERGGEDNVVDCEVLGKGEGFVMLTADGF